MTCDQVTFDMMLSSPVGETDAGVAEERSRGAPQWGVAPAQGGRGDALSQRLS